MSAGVFVVYSVVVVIIIYLYMIVYLLYDGFSDVEIKEFESYLKRILDNMKSEYYK